MSMHRYLQTAFLISAIVLMSTGQELAGQDDSISPNLSASQIAQELSHVESNLGVFAQNKLAFESRLSKLQAQLEDLQNQRSELLKQQDKLGVSSASYDEIMRLLQTQKVQLTIDLAGIEARRDAMIEQRELGKKAESENNVPVAESLKELGKIQNERLRQIEAMHAKGVAPQSEVLDAKQQLLEVQIRLAGLSNPNGADRQPLDGEMINISLSRAETVARLHKVDQLLEEYSGSRASFDSLARIQSEISSAESSLTDVNRVLKHDNTLLDSLNSQKQQLAERLKKAQDEKQEKKQ